MPTHVFSISQQLFEPRVNVLCKGKVPGEQAVKTDEPLTLLIPTEGTSLRTMILEGSLQRFRKEIDLSSASVAISSAVTLMPETAKDLDDVVMLQELTEVEAPEHKSCGCTWCSTSARAELISSECGRAISDHFGTVSFVGPSTLPRA